jgi:hypothetical protein
MIRVEPVYILVLTYSRLCLRAVQRYLRANHVYSICLSLYSDGTLMARLNKVSKFNVHRSTCAIRRCHMSYPAIDDIGLTLEVQN